MLQQSFAELSRDEQLLIQQYKDVFYFLLRLTDVELELVKNDLCRLAPGPDLNVQYAIVQQRHICLTDLKEFFKTFTETPSD